MASRPFQDITYGAEAGLGVITINRPQQGNKLRTQTYEEILAALRLAEDDPSVGVVVLTGAGNCFSVGGDFSAHGRRSRADFRRHLGILMEVATKLRTLGKPTIAAVNGDCFGGAHQLALLCDLTIASENARLGQHGVQRGTAPIFWGTQLLPRIVGEKRAREIVLLCRQYSAAEAYAMGLCNKVVPSEKLWDEVLSWGRELLAMSPRSLRMAKVSLNFASDMLYPAMWHAREMLSEVAQTEEFQEAVRALEEGRPADFTRFRAG